MRFTLTIPPALATDWTAASPTSIVARSGAFTIAIVGLHPLPDDLDAWIATALRRETPDGAQLEIGRGTDQATARRWPMRLVDARVLVDGAPVEVRVAAFYRFFEYGGIALARAASGSPDPALAQEALAILATAEPDWSSEVVTVEELWAP